MELKQIKELMTAMGRTGMKRLSLKKDAFELQLERGENGQYRMEGPFDLSDEGALNEASRRANIALSRAKESTSLLTAAASGEKKEEAAPGIFVTSPMVGTFYASPSPDDPPFVKLGDKVDKSTVLCIIEAMKVMNEVKAGIIGTVAEILVDI